MQRRAENEHISVLTKETIDALNLRRDFVVIDATFGAGGHTCEILGRLNENGMCISIDADKTAFSGWEPDAHHHLIHGNFRDIKSLADSVTEKPINAIVADLGWRQEQFAGSGKGFSFTYDEPLLMTYGEPESYPFTAKDIVNDWDEAVLADIIYGYGEERKARQIARAITTKRTEQPITTTFELLEVISSVVPTKRGRIHGATKTFQALRIAVNDELEALKLFITDAFDLLAPHGRLSIITFHSLEDRIVKLMFRDLARDQRGVLVNKKPIAPTREEVFANPRARSAKLRTIERV